MATEITMPQLSDTMDEGTILTWLKKEGDSVQRGDALAEVATDKADLEIESFHEGVLLKIHSPAGTKVRVGSVIALVGEAGEQVVGGVNSVPQQATAPQPQPSTQSHGGPSHGGPSHAGQTHTGTAASGQPNSSIQAPAQQTPPPQAYGGNGNGTDRIKISPLAKNLAQAHGVDYQSVQGTGDGGRIVKRDIEGALGREFSADDIDTALSGETAGRVNEAPQAQPSPTQVSQAQPRPAERVQPAPTQAPSAQQSQQSVGAAQVPLSRMRATIATRMAQAMSEIPHFYLTVKLEVDALSRMRESLKVLPQYEGLTFNHLIVKAAALALKAHPRINAAYRDGNLLQPAQINVGIITALEDGLLIPVVKNADAAPLADIVSDSKALVQRARSGRPKPDDLVGGTFSISNIGRAPVEDFTAVINPGQGAILAVAGIQEEALVKQGQVVVGKVMRVTLSVDHRIIDGVIAGEYLAELKRLIEDPVLLLA
ncbi:MAG: 2-oxo acid dehydrogenase subunit E2 [Bdellovibrionales bacterium]|nr:2-oxo acid dehydrogenase subunit E2 [Bdellovibrionales bacterium]